MKSKSKGYLIEISGPVYSFFWLFPIMLLLVTPTGYKCIDSTKTPWNLHWIYIRESKILFWYHWNVVCGTFAAEWI